MRRVKSIVLLGVRGCRLRIDAHFTSSIETRGIREWQTSPYVLPYAVGQSYFVDQGNCSPPGNGHTGAAKFGYDFQMPIGTPIYARARGPSPWSKSRTSMDRWQRQASIM
jgi:hypothetical protein